MVVNTIIAIGNKRPAPLVPTRPRPSVANISSQQMRQHEALMEARRRANVASSDLNAATTALSAANAEHDRLTKRIKELEAENARLRKDLARSENECEVLSKALDNLKAGTIAPCGHCEQERGPVEPAEPVEAAPAEAVSAEAAPAEAVSAEAVSEAPAIQMGKRKRHKKNKGMTITVSPAPDSAQ